VDIFVRTLPGGPTVRESVTALGVQGDGPSEDPAISRDGKILAFASYATNLVPNDTNGFEDVFVRCDTCGTTERVSVMSNGSQRNAFAERPSLSSDGRYVSWDGGQAYVRDRQTGITELVSMSTGGVVGDQGSETTSISGDGKYIAFVGTRPT